MSGPSTQQPQDGLVFPSRQDLCCVHACVCCSLGFFCKQPKCIAVKVDAKVSVSLQNIYVDLREQFLCMSVAVQLPLNVAKLGGSPTIACMGITCKDCGDAYALPKCCCGCEPKEPVINRMEDLCCRSGYLCCVLGYKCTDCCAINGKAYATLGDGLPCKFLGQGSVCCYNGFINCPCDEVPVVCAYLGWQCWPTPACHCCTIKCCGTMPGTPTPPESSSIIRKGEVVSPDAAVPLMARSDATNDYAPEGSVDNTFSEELDSSVPATPMVGKNAGRDPSSKGSKATAPMHMPPPVPADNFAGTLVNGVVCFICPTGPVSTTNPSSGKASSSPTKKGEIRVVK